MAQPAATPRGATFRPLTASPLGPASYSVSDPEALAAFLSIRGWQRLPGCSKYELCRMKLGGQLIVLYQSGTALVQGLAPERTHAALAELLEVR